VLNFELFVQHPKRWSWVTS